MSDIKPREWEPGEFDYFDFGCSDGANIRFVEQYWPTLHGLGVDIDSRKIELAVKSGHDAIVYNILNLPTRKNTRFVTMSHFLEHLNSVSDAAKMIRKAIDIAEGFVLIRQPWFDADGLLLSHGLKFYWSHWHGHPNRMSTMDFYAILFPELSAGRIHGYEIFGRGLIKTTGDSCFIPLDAPIDQHHYDSTKHGFRPARMELPIPVFKEIVVVIKIGQDSLCEEMLAKLGGLNLLYRSAER